MTSRKAATGAGDAASNGEVGCEQYDQDNVTYGDIVPMEPVDKPESDYVNQEQLLTEPNIIYSELTLNGQ